MSMSALWVLDDDGTPQPTEDLEAWATQDRQVALDVVGDVTVSTVFPGVDQRADDEGPPVLWETMAFGGHMDGKCWRFEQRELAERFHVGLVEHLRQMEAKQWSRK